METLTTQVWKLDFAWAKSPAAALTVSLAIARRSFSTGACWASLQTLAEDTFLSKKTVRRTLEELGEKGWVERHQRQRPDGGRSSNRIWLTLPQVTLEATSYDPDEARRMDAYDDMALPVRKSDPVVTESTQARQGDQGPGTESPGPVVTETTAFLKESSKGKDEAESRARTHAGEGELAIAVDMIWEKASQVGRQRSSKADIRKGLAAALARGHQMETILRGLAGYFASQDATKDDGAFQRGAHVILASDRFMSFLPDTPKEPATPTERAARAIVGDGEHATREVQALWMDLFSKGMPWNPERGPEPGRLGCRVDHDLQRQFGVEPFMLADAGDDAGAFD